MLLGGIISSALGLSLDKALLGSQPERCAPS